MAIALPRQAAAKLVLAGHCRERRTGPLDLSHDAELLLRTPTPTAISPDKDLHPTRP